MTTPTENPTCKHCGQSKSEHRPANYNDGVTIGQFLVCPFATFEAETETNLSGGVEGHAHSLRGRVPENQWGSSGKETGNPMPSENQASPAQNLSPAKEEEKFYMGWAIRIAQTSTFQQAAEHLKQFEIEARQQLKPRGQPMPEVIIPPAQSLSSTQDKLCAEWANDDGRWTTQNNVELNLRRFLREALREPAPEAGIGQPYTEQLERDNAELRRKLEETQQPDPDAGFEAWWTTNCADSYYFGDIMKEHCRLVWKAARKRLGIHKTK